jgi:hypothetical protein
VSAQQASLSAAAAVLSSVSMLLTSPLASPALHLASLLCLSVIAVAAELLAAGVLPLSESEAATAAASDLG